jgi:glutamate-ammonia-ligase adenylyltransferase
MDAYVFLRDVEHRLQMENNLQTHSIPADTKARERLARLMGFAKRAEFEKALRQHTDFVRASYDDLLKADPSSAAATVSLPDRFKGRETDWKSILTEHGFRDPERAFRLLNEFANGPGYGHVSTRTTELAFQLIPKILSLCLTPAQMQSAPMGRLTQTTLSDPDRVLARLDSFVSAYGARSTLFESWTSNPTIFELLVLLFDRSEFLAELAIRTPDLVDELVLSGQLRKSKTAAETLADLRHGLADADQRKWIRQYHQAEFMRLGLRDILGLSQIEQSQAELSALADACLQYALEVVVARRKLKRTALAIFGLGKLGGQELTYGSDLDIIFVADVPPAKLPQLQLLAVDVMDLLSLATEHGNAFVTDARLRPDGEKGLLVNTPAAYQEYYERRAQLWEIQALSRLRPVAGDVRLGAQIVSMAANLVQAAPKKWPDWKAQIARMRERVELERTPPGQDALAIKTGRGGLMDAEFLAQAACLESGWPEPNTLRALLRMQAAKVLPPDPAEKLLASYRELRRIESILRRWSFEGEAVLPTDPAAFKRVSIRCGFASPDHFRSAVAEWRENLRQAYSQYFAAARSPQPPSGKTLKGLRR